VTQSPMKLKLWRVRAIQQSEAWVETIATSAAHAEDIVSTKPGIVSVMRGMAVPGDKVAGSPIAGVEDDDS